MLSVLLARLRGSAGCRWLRLTSGEDGGMLVEYAEEYVEGWPFGKPHIRGGLGIPGSKAKT